MARDGLRKLCNGVIMGHNALRSRLKITLARLNSAISVGPRVFLDQGVVLRATDGGRITLGRNVSIGRFARIIARGGNIEIGDDVLVSEGCVIAAMAGVRIGADTQIAEYVTTRDQDHNLAPRPIRTSGFTSAPVTIGRDVWLGAKASVLRGATIGDGAVIGAHAVVRGDIPAFSLAVGVPARVVREMAQATRASRHPRPQNPENASTS